MTNISLLIDYLWIGYEMRVGLGCIVIVRFIAFLIGKDYKMGLGSVPGKPFFRSYKSLLQPLKVSCGFKNGL